MSVPPHLVGPPDAHVPQQIRVDPMPATGHAQPGLGVNRLQAHDAHQPLHPLAVDRLALPDQPGGQLPAAEERVRRVLLVDEPHQPQVLGRLTRRLVVQARPIQSEQLALPTDAQLGMAHLDQGPQSLSRVRQLFFEPFQVHFEPADLLVQLGLAGLGVGSADPGAAGEHRLGAGHQLLLPAVDQRRMDPEMAGQLVDGAVALDRRQGDLGLERRRVLLPFDGHRHPFLGPPE